eukprot:gene850-841_t
MSSNRNTEADLPVEKLEIDVGFPPRQHGDEAPWMAWRLAIKSGLYYYGEDEKIINKNNDFRQRLRQAVEALPEEEQYDAWQDAGVVSYWFGLSKSRIRNINLLEELKKINIDDSYSEDGPQARRLPEIFTLTEIDYDCLKTLFFDQGSLQGYKWAGDSSRDNGIVNITSDNVILTISVHSSFDPSEDRRRKTKLTQQESSLERIMTSLFEDGSRILEQNTGLGILRNKNWLQVAIAVRKHPQFRSYRLSNQKHVIIGGDVNVDHMATKRLGLLDDEIAILGKVLMKPELSIQTRPCSYGMDDEREVKRTHYHEHVITSSAFDMIYNMYHAPSYMCKFRHYPFYYDTQTDKIRTVQDASSDHPILLCGFTTGPGGNGAAPTSCEDTPGFIDSGGYDCSANIGDFNNFGTVNTLSTLSGIWMYPENREHLEYPDHLEYSDLYKFSERQSCRNAWPQPCVEMAQWVAILAQGLTKIRMDRNVAKAEVPYADLQQRLRDYFTDAELLMHCTMMDSDLKVSDLYNDLDMAISRSSLVNYLQRIERDLEDWGWFWSSDGSTLFYDPDESDDVRDETDDTRDETDDTRDETDESDDTRHETIEEPDDEFDVTKI